MPLFPALLLAVLQQAAAQADSDAEVFKRTRDEVMSRSQIMRTVHVLTDIHRPRLTGSPNHEAAAEWAKTRLLEWM